MWPEATKPCDPRDCSAVGAGESSPARPESRLAGTKGKRWVKCGTNQLRTAVGPGSPASPKLACWGGDWSAAETGAPARPILARWGGGGEATLKEGEKSR